MPEPVLARLPRISSRFLRLLGLMALTLMMFVPLQMVSFLVADRAGYQQQAMREVSQNWGGAVQVSGPVLVVPVEETQQISTRAADGSTSKGERKVAREPLLVLPVNLDARADLASQRLHRGIFDIPVFDAALDLEFGFDLGGVAAVTGPNETVLWDRAVLTLLLPQTRAIKGQAVLQAGERSFDLEPGSPLAGRPGIQALVGDPRGLQGFVLKIVLGGAGQFRFAPAGRQTGLAMTSNWPDPGFSGSFLPIGRETGTDGFTANWNIPHLSRDVPQVLRDAVRLEALDQAAFGVDLVDPVDFYTLSVRATKHGILFIALTFLAVFLTENAARSRIHPAQFLLIGMAQVVFFLLLLSLAEQIGFGAAYLASSAATVGLLTWYGHAALRLGQRLWILGLTLVVLYGTLFMILKSSDFALLAGSVLAFLAVAATMVATRNESWGTRVQAA